MSDEERKVQLEMDPAPPQQPNVSVMNTPPPSYEEAMPMPGSVSVSITKNVRPEFGSEPRQMSCRSCYRQVRQSELWADCWCSYLDCDGCQKWDLLLWLAVRHHLLPLWVLDRLLPGQMPSRVQEVHPPLSSLQITPRRRWAQTHQRRDRSHQCGHHPRHWPHCSLYLF